MIHFAAHDLSHLLALYGYWVVLVFVAIESTGIPFPGETTLLAASIYAGTTHQLSIVLVIAAAAAGAIIGDNFGNAIGREGGYRLVRRYGKYIRLDERKLKLGQYLFIKHGGKVIFFGRFVSVLRAWAAFLAGVNRMSWSRFFFFNAAGGIIWATIYGVGGYLLGDNVHRVAGPVGIALGVIAAIIIIAFLVFLKRNEMRLEDEAERALPGSLDDYRSGKRQPKLDEAQRKSSQPGNEAEGHGGHGASPDERQQQDTASPPPRASHDGFDSPARRHEHIT